MKVEIICLIRQEVEGINSVRKILGTLIVLQGKGGDVAEVGLSVDVGKRGITYSHPLLLQVCDCGEFF